MPRVYYTPADVENFNRAWPCSKIIPDSGYAEFDWDGNLVDVSDSLRGDGPEFSAFVNDLSTRVNYGESL